MGAGKFVLILILAAGCQDAREGVAEGEAPATREPAPANAPSPGPAPAITPDDKGWTMEPVEKKGSEVSTLTAVRHAAHPDYDRIVFEFDGPLPGYKVGYTEPPIQQCGSGETVVVQGDEVLKVNLFPTNAHTEAGQPTVTNRDVVLSGRNVKQFKSICDFEAVVEWVVGVGIPARFRVLELSGPVRLVVDVRQN
jgi:hypothetical protein